MCDWGITGGDSFQIMNKIIQITLHGHEQPWNEAQAVCESTGGNLLRLDSKEKQHALTHYQTPDPTWQQHRYVHPIIVQLNRGSYMCAHVLLNLSNESGKTDKIRGLPSILSLFRNEFNKINNTRARILNSIYHMTLR